MPFRRSFPVRRWLLVAAAAVAVVTVGAVATVTVLREDGPPAEFVPPTADGGGDLVVGYLTGWGRTDGGRPYTPRDVDRSGAAERLTHLVYAFGTVADGRCRSADPRAEHERAFRAAESVDGRPDSATGGLRGSFNQLRKLKAAHPQLKIIWSFGGWNDSAGFGEAARDPAAFARSCHELVEDSRWSDVFDGIDIDWEYPNACGRTCDSSGPGAFAAMTRALRDTFGPQALVTAAITGDGGEGGTADATDYAEAVGPLNWAMLMTYDYFGVSSSQGPTAPHSPLRAYDGMPEEGGTASAAVEKFTGMGIPARKLLLGIGFYGRGWTGVTSAEPGASASAAAEPDLKNYRDLAPTCPPTGTVGGTAYAFCDGEWWGYDTPSTIAAKMRYTREAGLGGAFAWELSGDTSDAALLKSMTDGLAS